MKKALLIPLLLMAQPVMAAPPSSDQLAESKLDHSSVSVMVEPQLNDGRLMVKIAAQNRTAGPVPFGPSSVSISRLDGTAIALIPLQQLIDNVRLAAGMKAEGAQASMANGYAAPQVMVNGNGHPDVSGYTGGSGIASDEIIRRSNQPSGPPTLTRELAEQQSQALRQAILQDAILQPGQVAAGEVVSEKLKFKKSQDRTLHLIIRLAGDEHGFTIAAPAD